MVLPSNLSKIRERLEEKHALSDEEQALLDELKKLDQALEELPYTERRSLRKTQIVSGPGGRCQCCGQRL